MTRYRKAQNNFSAGVIGERVYGRTDIQQYKNALRSMEGFIPLEQGGARTMPSTEIVGKDHKFAFSFKDTYLYWDASNVLKRYVDGVSDTTVTLLTHTQVDAFDFNKVNAFSTTVFVDDECHFVQTGDVMFVTFKDGLQVPHVVVEDPDTQIVTIAPWGLKQDIGLENLNIPADYACVPYSDQTTSGTTITVTTGGTYGYILTASGDFFTGTASNWNGRFIRVNFPTKSAIFYIRERSGLTSALAEVVVLAGLSGGEVTDDIQVAITGGNLQPATVTFHESRSVWGGQKEGLPIFAGSRANNIFMLMNTRLNQAVDEATDVSDLKFFGDPVDTDPYKFRISSNEYETIDACIGYNSLFIMTTKGVYNVQGGQVGITPTAIDVKKISNMRSSNVQPLGVNSSVIMADVDGKLYGIKYSFENSGYVLYDLTLLYKPLAGLTAMVYDYTNTIVYFKTVQEPAIGVPMATLTYCAYKESAGLTAFGSTSVGNYDYYAGNTFGVMSLLRFGDTVAFSRSAQNSGAIFTEVFSNNAVRLYGTLEFDEFALTHTVLGYANQTLTVIKRERTGYDADGYPEYTFSQEADITADGAGTITYASIPIGTTYFVGRTQQAKLVTVPPAVGAEAGDALDALGRIDRVTARFIATSGGKIGTRENYMADIFQLADEQPYSGIKQPSLEAGQSLETTVTIIQDDPFPMEITSLVYRGQTFE